MVSKIVNELLKNGVSVFRDDSVAVHVSGHACQEEIKLLIGLTRPKYFMPMHGEYKQMYANKLLAEYMGVPASNIFITDIGKVLEISSDRAEITGEVTSGKVLVDGYGIGDIGSVVLRDRKQLSLDGILAIVTTVDTTEQYIVSGPDVISRGFVYVKESEGLVEEIRSLAKDTIENCLYAGIVDYNEIKAQTKTAIHKFIFSQTGRKPMILPVIMDV